jgi:hypothetical protein
MPYVNQWTVVGHVGADAQLKTSATTGTQYAEFSLATKNSARENSTVWVKCRVFGKSVERVVDKCKKGDLVYVTGPLEHKEAYLNMAVNNWQWISASKKSESTEALPTVSTAAIPTFDENIEFPF